MDDVLPSIRLVLGTCPVPIPSGSFAANNSLYSFSPQHMSEDDFLPRREKPSMEGDAKERERGVVGGDLSPTKIYRDKKRGRRYIKKAGKKKYLPDGIGKNDPIKWLVKFYTKRKKRKPAGSYRCRIT